MLVMDKEATTPSCDQSIDFDFFDITVGSGNGACDENNETVKDKPQNVSSNGKEKIHRKLKSRKYRKLSAASAAAKERFSSGDSDKPWEKKTLKPEVGEISERGKDAISDSESDLDSISDSESSPDEECVQSSESESDDVTDVSPLSSSLSSLSPSILAELEEEEKTANNSINNERMITNCSSSSSSSPPLPSSKAFSKKHVSVDVGGITEKDCNVAWHHPLSTDKSKPRLHRESGDELGLLFNAIADDKRKCRHSSAPSSSGRSNSMCSTASSSNTPRELHSRSRKNYSFTNTEVKRIDIENQRLLKIISDKRCQPPKRIIHPTQKVKSSAAINRKKEQQRINMENAMLLKRLDKIHVSSSHRSRPTSANRSGRFSSMSESSLHNIRN